MAVYRPKYTDPKTGEKCEAETWWCDFTYKRRRIRESTGQTKKTLAKAYEDRRRRELENAIAGVTPKSDDRIREMKAVLEGWIAIRTAGKKDRTKAFIRERCAHLIAHFGSKSACDVNQAVVAEYVGKRDAE